MAVNLSNEARAACQSLVNDASWGVIIESIKDQVRKHMHDILGMEANAERSIGYAKALHDLYTALESGARNVLNNKVEKLNSLDMKASKNARE